MACRDEGIPADNSKETPSRSTLFSSSYPLLSSNTIFFSHLNAYLHLEIQWMPGATAYCKCLALTVSELHSFLLFTRWFFGIRTAMYCLKKMHLFFFFKYLVVINLANFINFSSCSESILSLLREAKYEWGTRTVYINNLLYMHGCTNTHQIGKRQRRSGSCSRT